MLVARTDPDAPKHQGLTYFIMDMEQEGVEVKPLVQITGEAEFNEIFMEEARIPEENVDRGSGQRLDRRDHDAHERADRHRVRVPGLAPDPAAQADRAREAARRRTAAPLAEDPVVRQRLAQLYIESEILRLSGYRGLTQVMKTGVPGPGGLARASGSGRRPTRR